MRPSLYFGLRRFLDSSEERWSVKSDTDITIDGFPRSSNSSTVNLFRSAQSLPVKISHHRHHAANIIRSARWKIPTVVLVRKPLDATLSLLALSREGFQVHGRKNRGFFLKPEDGLYGWVSYYKAIFPYRDQFIVAPFDKVAGDIGPMVQAVNAKWRTNFGSDAHMEPGDGAESEMGRHALPTTLRTKIKADLLAQYEEDYSRSKKLRTLYETSNRIFEQYHSLCPF